MQSIIEQAVQLEKKAEDNYRAAARATTDAGAVPILQLLADQEAEHARLLRGMEENPSPNQDLDLIARARAWVQGAVEGGANAISPDSALLDVLHRAMDIEHQTETFYQEQAESTEDESLGALFSRLAKAEREHYLFVGSLVEYFSRPQEWVEDAEFGLRDEY